MVFCNEGGTLGSVWVGIDFVGEAVGIKEGLEDLDVFDFLCGAVAVVDAGGFDEPAEEVGGLLE